MSTSDGAARGGEGREPGSAPGDPAAGFGGALATILDAIGDPVFVKDEAHRWVFLNHAYGRLFGYERDALLGRSDAELFPPDAVARFWASDESVLATGEPSVYEETVVDRHGIAHEIVVTKTLAAWDGRRHIVGVIQDVTERRRAESARAALYEIAETASAAEDLPAFYAALHRVVGTLMYAGNFFIALHEPGRITFPYFVDERDESPGEIPFGRGLTAHVIRTGKPLHATDADTARLEAESGIVPFGSAPVDWLGVPLKSTGPAFGALVVQSYDAARRFSSAEVELLTFVSRHIATAIERRRAASALAEMAVQYRLLFERNPHPMWVQDVASRRLIAVNDAAARLYGYGGGELLGRTVDEIEPAGEDDDGARRHLRKDGSLVEVEVTSHELRFEGKDAQLVMAIDVTERRSLEEQLRQSQKMDAVGKLAGGIAHDFNNILTTILGYSDLLLPHVRDAGPAREHVLEIKGAVERAAALTRRLLAFSRKQVVEPTILDVNAVLADSGSLLKRLIGEDVELVLETEPALGLVRADPGQMEQILMNLVLNARDAMPGGGRVFVTTRNVELTGEEARDRLSLSPGAYVRLSVKDDGTGMDAETMRQMFEPFFTTKPKGKGTGLGLAVVYGIVKQSGGWVWAESAPGSGATFHVDLPRVDAQAADARRAAPVSRKTGGGKETILLVEDDDRIRALAREVLSTAGYSVLEAPDGDTALVVAGRYPAGIHLLLTDVVMPRLNGRELAVRLAERRPGIRVLYTSGYTDDALSAHDLLQPGAGLLRKPFGPAELLERVRRTLGKA